MRDKRAFQVMIEDGATDVAEFGVYGSDDELEKTLPDSVAFRQFWRPDAPDLGTYKPPAPRPRRGEK